MSEQEATQKHTVPITLPYLVEQFKSLGLASKHKVLVHSSLKSFGWVCGGPQTIILALEEVLKEGTLLMPTHSSALSEPSEWCNPPVPESWWPIIRETMPAFQTDLTPCRGMGVIPETFRKQEGVKRSYHPNGSFAAWGQDRDFCLLDHSLENAFGEQSPLARLYDLDGYVLLLGVGYDSNTSLHLAEWRANYPEKKMDTCGAPIIKDGQSQWVTYQDLSYNEDDFKALGHDFEKQCPDAFRFLTIGQAKCRLIRQRPLVDFAVKWFEEKRRRVDSRREEE